MGSWKSPFSILAVSGTGLGGAASERAHSWGQKEPFRMGNRISKLRVGGVRIQDPNPSLCRTDLLSAPAGALGWKPSQLL